MSGPRIAIVDYQAGNLHSVQKALERFGVRPVVTADPLQVQRADALVVPGQGACDSAMRQMRERGLEQPIREFIASGRPYLGICLGLQLLLEASDEGDEPCLGVLRGRVRKLPPGQKIPHMGWNQVQFRGEHPVLDGGQFVNGNLADYTVPKAEGLPNFASILVESNDPNGPFGAKGCSECALNACGAVIANAVYDATGSRIPELPIVPHLT